MQDMSFCSVALLHTQTWEKSELLDLTHCKAEPAPFNQEHLEKNRKQYWGREMKQNDQISVPDLLNKQLKGNKLTEKR